MQENENNKEWRRDSGDEQHSDHEKDKKKYEEENLRNKKKSKESKRKRRAEGVRRVKFWRTPPRTYGESSSAYGESSSAYGESSSAYGESSRAYGESSRAYGESSSAYEEYDWLSEGESLPIRSSTDESDFDEFRHISPLTIDTSDDYNSIEDEDFQEQRHLYALPDIFHFSRHFDSVVQIRDSQVVDQQDKCIGNCPLVSCSKRAEAEVKTLIENVRGAKESTSKQNIEWVTLEDLSRALSAILATCDPNLNSVGGESVEIVSEEDEKNFISCVPFMTPDDMIKSFCEGDWRPIGGKRSGQKLPSDKVILEDEISDAEEELAEYVDNEEFRSLTNDLLPKAPEQQANAPHSSSARFRLKKRRVMREMIEFQNIERKRKGAMSGNQLVEPNPKQARYDEPKPQKGLESKDEPEHHDTGDISKKRKLTEPNIIGYQMPKRPKINVAKDDEKNIDKEPKSDDENDDDDLKAKAKKPPNSPRSGD